MTLRLNIISGLFILLSSLSSLYGQEVVDCSEFKTGKFHYAPISGGEVTLKRTKKKQTERYNNENQKFIFSITWTDACEYELVLIKTKGIPKEKSKEIIGTRLNCKVTDAALDHYDVEIKTDGTSKVENVTIYSNR